MQARELQLEGPGHVDRAAVDLERRCAALADLRAAYHLPMRGDPDTERWALLLYGGLESRAPASREVRLFETQGEALRAAAQEAGMTEWAPELLVNLGTGRAWPVDLVARPGALMDDRRFGAAARAGVTSPERNA